MHNFVTGLWYTEVFLINVCIRVSAFVKTPADEAVWEFYSESTLSVEVLKDDVLQKVYFRVKDKVRGEGDLQRCYG